MKRVQWIAVLSCLFLLVPNASFPWSGKVVVIVKADQIKVLRDNAKIENVRLYGIVSPGEPQPFGKEAKAYTTKRLSGKTVEVTPILRDNFNRIIGYVKVDGHSFIDELLKNGMTWWYRKYVPWELGLASLEAKARRAGVGLWARPAPVPPWEFRPLGPREGAGPHTPFSLGRRGGVREKIIQEIGPSRKVIRAGGYVKRKIEKLCRPENVGEPFRLEDLEHCIRFLGRSRGRDIFR